MPGLIWRVLLVTVALSALSLASPIVPSGYAAGSGSFSQTGSLSVGRVGSIAAALPDGRVLIGGGLVSAPFQPQATASTEIFDPARNGFVSGPQLNVPRAFAAGAPLRDGRILIVGGHAGSSDLDSSEILDPRTGMSTPGPDLGTPREGPIGASLPDGRVIVAGGSDAGTPLDSAEVYDPQTNAFTQVASMSTARTDATASSLPDGRVLIIGGYGTAVENSLATTEIFDPATDHFQPGPQMPYGVRGATASPLPDGRVLLAGGFRQYASVDAEVFLPGPGPLSSSGIGPLDIQCSGGGGSANSASAPLPDGRVLVAGGGYGGRCSGEEVSTAKVFAATNSFKVRRKGMKLFVNVSATGTASVVGSAFKLRRASAEAAKKPFAVRRRSAFGGPGTLKLRLVVGKGARRLAKSGRLRLKLRVSFSPQGGLAAQRIVKLRSAS